MFADVTGQYKKSDNLFATKQIYTVLRQNAEGKLYGITFVDNQNKCVFNGSDIGKGYSTAALQNRIVSSGIENLKNEVNQNVGATNKSNNNLKSDLNTKAQEAQYAKNDSLLNVLISPKQEFGNTPFQLLKRKKKKGTIKILLDRMWSV